MNDKEQNVIIDLSKTNTNLNSPKEKCLNEDDNIEKQFNADQTLL